MSVVQQTHQPEKALRELILNAVIHRNYMMSSCVQVAVYDDRVEISSPGALYGTLTLEEALSGRSSIRNKLLASVCEKLGVVEGWGTGLKKIIDTCKELKIRPPEFLEIGDLLRVNFYRVKIGEPNNDTINENTREKTREKTRGKNKTREKIIQAIKNKPDITTAELSSLLEISSKGVEWQLRELKKKGVIRRVGADKGGHWEIIEN